MQRPMRQNAEFSCLLRPPEVVTNAQNVLNGSMPNMDYRVNYLFYFYCMPPTTFAFPMTSSFIPSIRFGTAYIAGAA